MAKQREKSVADGYKRAYEASIGPVRSEVEQEFAARLAKADALSRHG